MNPINQIASPEPVNLIYNSGSNYSSVTLAVMFRGMKITSVTFNSNSRPIGQVTEHEIELKSTDLGLTIVLPSNSDIISRDLPKIP